MNRYALAAVGVAVGVAWWASRRDDGAGQGASSGLLDDVIGVFEMQQVGFTMHRKTSADLLPGSNFRRVRTANMAAVPRDLVDHPNVRAAMGMIRVAEGTASTDGYKMLFGGKLFSSYADHPRLRNPWPGSKFGYSTAAGAFQILSENPAVWDDVKDNMGLSDFSPESQRLAALGLMAYRGVLPDIIDGRIVQALGTKSVKGLGLAWEWASLPTSDGQSVYGQTPPKMTVDRVKALFVANGGVLSQ